MKHAKVLLTLLLAFALVLGLAVPALAAKDTSIAIQADETNAGSDLTWFEMWILFPLYMGFYTPYSFMVEFLGEGIAGWLGYALVFPFFFVLGVCLTWAAGISVR